MKEFLLFPLSPCFDLFLRFVMIPSASSASCSGLDGGLFGGFFFFLSVGAFFDRPASRRGFTIAAGIDGLWNRRHE